MATRFQHLLPVLNRLADSSAPVDLDQVGRDACLSPTRAQRVFAEEIGESPKQYQLRVRLQRAAALLLGSDARVVDIAVASGFGSHEAFTRAFRRTFGRTPSSYRAEFGRWSEPEAIKVVAGAAPCVGLHRRPLDRPTDHVGKPVPGPSRVHEQQPPKHLTHDHPTDEQPTHEQQERENTMANPDIEITRRDVADLPVLYGTRKLEKDKVGDGLAEVLPAAFGHAMAEGLAMSGPPFVRYIEFGPATFTVEAGVQLAEPAPAPPDGSGLSAGLIPAASVATAVHKGPYETLGDTYLAIERWVEAEGLSAAGPPWEVYLTDPAEVPDPAEWLTEINWPIA